MPVTKNIFIFGDSITYGEWDHCGGWANRIRSHFDNTVLPVPDDYIITYNLGIPSDTSEGLAQRLTAETQSRLTPNPSVSNIEFIIAIGANDTRWITTENRRGIELDQFRSNIQKITTAAQLFSSDITFIGLLPCIEHTVLLSAQKHNWVETYDNQTLALYNDVIKRHCQQSSLDFIDLFTVFMNDDYEALLSDGLHPNSNGHALICDVIISKLSKQN